MDGELGLEDNLDLWREGFKLAAFLQSFAQ